MTARKPANNRILVVKLADIGDAVLSLPAIQALRTARSAARTDVLTTNVGARVFALSPAVDRIITLDKSRFDRPIGFASPRGALELARLTWRLRRGRYDTVLLFHHLTTEFGARKFQLLARASGGARVIGLDNGRAGFLDDAVPDFGFGEMPEWRYNLEVARRIAPGAEPERPRLSVPEDARASAKRLLAASGVSDRFVVVHPTVGDYAPARAWPAGYFAQAARSIADAAGCGVVVVGAGAPGQDHPAWAELGFADLTGQTSIAELCAVLERARLVVGSDSAIVHLAAVLERPYVAVFGPSNYAAWKPYAAVEHVIGRDRVPNAPGIAIRADIPCSPCFYAGFELGRPGGCALRTCLTLVRPDAVADIAIALLENRETGSYAVSP
jgi:ADP-heptose:LPS heptosyltransferase